MQLKVVAMRGFSHKGGRGISQSSSSSKSRVSTRGWGHIYSQPRNRDLIVIAGNVLEYPSPLARVDLRFLNHLHRRLWCSQTEDSGPPSTKPESLV